MKSLFILFCPTKEDVGNREQSERMLLQLRVYLLILSFVMNSNPETFNF